VSYFCPVSFSRYQAVVQTTESVQNGATVMG